MYFLASRSVNNGFPFLPSMVDAFSRDRLLAKCAGQKVKEAQEWISSIAFGIKLKEKDAKLPEKVAAGITGYCNRICPLFQYKTLTLVDDSIEHITKYIVS
eukprot:165115_1